MRITFDCKEKSSGVFFSKTYSEVILTVVFSEEELAVIHKHGLKKMLVMDRDPDAITANRFKNDQAYLQSLVDAGNWALTVGKLMKGPDSYICRTPAHAKVYQGKVLENLKEIKATIAGSVEAPESATIEL